MAQQPAVEVRCGDEAATELAADALWAAGAVAVAVDGSRVVAGFAGIDAARAAVEAVGERWPATLELVDDRSWRDEWRRHAAVQRVGRLVVRPVWVPLGSSRPEDVVLELEPGWAFGDASHPTTRACLEAVVAQARPGTAVLDVGCGSGILAVAAARLGAGPVRAIDVDPHAVQVTAANAGRNGVAVRVDGAPLAAVDGSFDLVVANLGGTRVVVDLAADLAGVTAPGGLLVVAGLLEGRERPAVEALAGHGLAVVHRTVAAPWACLHARPV